MTDTAKLLLVLFAMVLAAFLCMQDKLASKDTADTIFWALALVLIEKPLSATIGAITVTAQAKMAESKAKERAP